MTGAGLIGIRRMKGLIKVFSGGSAMLREWRMIGLLRGCMSGSVQVVAEEVD